MTPSAPAGSVGRVLLPPTDDGRRNLAREIGHRLHRLRVARAMTQEQVAQAAGISAYTYQKFEKGESKPGTPLNPRLFTLLALADLFEVSIGDLVDPARS